MPVDPNNRSLPKRTMLDPQHQETISSVRTIFDPAMNFSGANTSVHTLECQLSSHEKEITSKPKDPSYETTKEGGYGWLVVFGSFMAQITCFGTASWVSELRYLDAMILWSLGIMQAYYEQHVFGHIADAQFQLSFVGTLMEVFVNLMGPVAQILTATWGTRPTLILGTLLASAGLELAGFSSEIWHLYLTQGVMFGAGASFLYATAISTAPEWFDKRRGLALGLASSGSGIGGLVLPFILTPINNTLGIAWAYRVLGFICLGCDIVTCVFVKPKYPTAKGRKSMKEIFDFDVLKDANYALWCCGSVISLMGYFVPYFFLPSYAAHLNFSSTQGSTLIAVMSASNFIGRILVGFVGDYIGRLNADIIFTLICGCSSFLLWTFATTYGICIAFAVVFGISCGSYFALMSPLTYAVVGKDRFPTGLSMLLLFNIISVFGPSIASGIENTVEAQPFLVYKIFSGTTYVVGGLILFILKLKMTRKLFSKI